MFVFFFTLFAEEELQRKQRESEQSLDESSQESTENTDRVKEVLVDKDIQQSTIEENVSPIVDPKVREQSSPISLSNNNKMAKKKAKVANENNVEKEIENKDKMVDEEEHENDDINLGE